MYLDTSAILLVSDDDEIIAATRRRLLAQGNDLPVAVARTSAQARDLLRPDAGRPSRPPALIMLDLTTPDMNGFDLVIHVRADPATRGVPVMVLPTVEPGTTTRELLSGEEHAGDSSVPTPRTAQELRATLEALGVTWPARDAGLPPETRPASRRDQAPRRTPAPRLAPVPRNDPAGRRDLGARAS
ncbi:hypothetical protein [Kineosporia succinea]|uniref:Two-component system response regulator n=1 Tax=Kineosporia succinea TaxID=84632 RepID=A0ABT9PBH2_9ACTN|nr:hypothetical protein [Kineosporia succinea]MDP9829832.1 two-component system response regulator [Kineosporia succinea]